LAADGLNKMIQQGVSHNHLVGLGSVIRDSFKVINLQYADNTLLFLKANVRMVENLKWLFIAFEGISELKVNLLKSELIPLNLTSYQSFHFARILGCKLGKLPLKYLGVSLLFG
jgi:hypothetical protein